MLAWRGEAFTQKGSFLDHQERWKCAESQGSVRAVSTLSPGSSWTSVAWSRLKGACCLSSQWIRWKYMSSWSNCGLASPIPDGRSPEVNPLRTSGTVPEYDFCRADEGYWLITQKYKHGQSCCFVLKMLLHLAVWCKNSCQFSIFSKDGDS